MNSTIIAFLAQDGATSGAIYAMVAIALVLVFSITRVIFVPQGEIASLAALSLAGLQDGRMPGTVWILLVGAWIVAATDAYGWYKTARSKLLRSALVYFLLPFPALAFASFASSLPESLLIIATLLIVVPLGPVIYRIAFDAVPDASVLALLIIAVAVHFILSGLGLLIFGAEGVRTPPLFTAQFQLGGVPLSGQAVFVWFAAIVLMLALYFFFNLTLTGKVLRATAFNHVGARLVGMSPRQAGTLAFLLASGIGAVSGLLIAPLTTMYYDTGFIIGLKGFIAAISGGLVSYPQAAVGALAIGLLESFSSFWASTFKDVIVFLAILPILLVRGLYVGSSFEEEEE